MQNLLEALKALADENRLKIVILLLRHDFCVGALARQLGISPAAVSQQLQVLRRAGLVRGEKRGYWRHYAVDREALLGLARGLEGLTQGPEVSRYGCHGQPGGEVNRGKGLREGRGKTMCKGKCQKPENLETEPGKCSPEQVKECHGDGEDHPCLEEKQ